MQAGRWGIKDMQTNKKYLLRPWVEIPIPLQECIALLNIAPANEYVEGLGKRWGSRNYEIECDFDWEDT